jgi:hypothetical protein
LLRVPNQHLAFLRRSIVAVCERTRAVKARRPAAIVSLKETNPDEVAVRTAAPCRGKVLIR